MYYKTPRHFQENRNKENQWQMKVMFLLFLLYGIANAFSGATSSCTNPLFSGTPCNPPGTGSSSAYQVQQVFSNMPCGNQQNAANDCILQAGILSQFAPNSSCNGQPLTDFTKLCAGNKNVNGILFNINIDRGCVFNFTFETVSAEQSQMGCSPQDTDGQFCYPDGKCPNTNTQKCAVLNPTVNITVTIDSLKWVRQLHMKPGTTVQTPFEYWSFQRDLNYYRPPNEEKYCCTNGTAFADYATNTMSCFQNCGTSGENCQFLTQNSEVGGENGYCCTNNFYPGTPNMHFDKAGGIYDGFSNAGAAMYSYNNFLSWGFVMANYSATPSVIWADSVHPWDLLNTYLTKTTPAMQGLIPVAPSIVSTGGSAHEAAIPEYQFYTPGRSSFCGNIIDQLDAKLPQGQSGNVLAVFSLFYNSMFNYNDCDIDVPPNLNNADGEGHAIRGGYWMPLYPTTYSSTAAYTSTTNQPNQYALQCSYCGGTAIYCRCTDGTVNQDCNGHGGVSVQSSSVSPVIWSLNGMICDTSSATARVKCLNQCFNGESRPTSGICPDGQVGATDICNQCMNGACDSFQAPADDAALPGGFSQKFWVNGMAPECYITEIGDAVTSTPVFDVTVTVSQIFGTSNTIPIVSTIRLTNVSTVSESGGCGQFNSGSDPNLYVGITPSGFTGSLPDPLGQTQGYIGFCTSNPSNPNACQWNTCDASISPPQCGQFEPGVGVLNSYQNMWASQKNEFLPPDQPLGCKCCMPIQQPLEDGVFRHWWFWDADEYNSYVYSPTSTSQAYGCGSLGMQPTDLWGSNDQTSGHDTVVGSWEQHNQIGLQAQICSSWQPGGVYGYNPLNGFTNYTGAQEAYGGFAGLCRPKVTPCSIAAEYAYYEAIVQQQFSGGFKEGDTCPSLGQIKTGVWDQYTPDEPNMQIFISAADNTDSSGPNNAKCNSQCNGAKNPYPVPYPYFVSYNSGVSTDVSPAVYGFNLFVVIGNQITSASEIVGLLFIPEGEDQTNPCALVSYYPGSGTQTIDIGTVNLFTAVSTSTNYNFGPQGPDQTPPIVYDAGTLSNKNNIYCCLALPSSNKTCYTDNINLGHSVFNQTFHVLCTRSNQQAIDCATNGLGTYSEGTGSNTQSGGIGQTTFSLRSCNTQIKQQGASVPCTAQSPPPTPTSTPVGAPTPAPPNSPPPPLGPTTPPSTPTPKPTTYPNTITPTPSILAPVPTDNAHSTTFWLEIGGVIVLILSLLACCTICLYCFCKKKV